MKKITSVIAVILVSVICMGAARNVTPTVTKKSVAAGSGVLVNWSFTCSGASNWLDNSYNLTNWQICPTIPTTTAYTVSLEGTANGGGYAYTIASMTGVFSSGSPFTSANSVIAPQYRINVTGMLSQSVTGNVRILGY